jgi:hypothetical protein
VKALLLLGEAYAGEENWIASEHSYALANAIEPSQGIAAALSFVRAKEQKNK